MSGGHFRYNILQAQNLRHWQLKIVQLKEKTLPLCIIVESKCDVYIYLQHFNNILVAKAAIFSHAWCHRQTSYTVNQGSSILVKYLAGLLKDVYNESLYSHPSRSIKAGQGSLCWNIQNIRVS